MAKVVFHSLVLLFIMDIIHGVSLRRNLQIGFNDNSVLHNILISRETHPEAVENQSLMQQLTRIVHGTFESDTAGAEGWNVVKIYEKDNMFAMLSVKNDIEHGRMCTMAIRGSDDLGDWARALMPFTATLETTKYGPVKIHAGFASCFQTFSDVAKEEWLEMNNNGSCTKSYIAGHSMGASVALIAKLDGWPGTGFGFACPRTVAMQNLPFDESFNRIALQSDPVNGAMPELVYGPEPWSRYAHYGGLILFHDKFMAGMDRIYANSQMPESRQFNVDTIRDFLSFHERDSYNKAVDINCPGGTHCEIFD